MISNEKYNTKRNEKIISSKPIKVLMLPDCRQANPYQFLLADALEKQGVEVSFFNEYRRVFPLLRTLINQQHNFDVIHLHWILPFVKGKSWYTKTIYAVKFLLELIVLKCVGIRMVWTIHNCVTHDTNFPQLELWIRRKLAWLADSLILHNRETMKDLANEYNFDLHKATAISHGHYRQVYQKSIDSQQARQKLNLPISGNIYLHLGLLRPYKGIENLLQVWQDNQFSFKEDTLVIAGKPSKDYKQKLEQLIFRSNIILIPQFIENEEIHLFFSAATAVVLPYISLLNSGSLILAMSYGKPIIAPKLGSIPEVLGEANTLLYDPEDYHGLLEAMKTIPHIDLKKLSQQVTQVCDSLDWNFIANQTKKVYQTAITQ